MSPLRSAAAALAVALGVLAACTEAPDGVGESPSDRLAGPATSDGADGAVLRVIASETGPEAEEQRTYLDGMRLAAEELGDEVGLRVDDDGGDAARARTLLAEALRDPETVAVLAVGSGAAIEELRPEVEQAGTPIVLLGDDLYTPRGLFRQVFQTGVPLRWQAEVMARYLVQDRGYRRVVVVTEPGPPWAAAREALVEAMAWEGSAVAASVVLRPGDGLGGVRSAARGTDALVYLGGLTGGRRLVEALGELDDAPQLAAPTDILQRSFARGLELPPGTVACAPYAWAPWAGPVPRIGEFRARLRDRFGHPPRGFEQEGYDAVALVAAALDRSGDGDDLIAAMESFRRRQFSALPVHLRPDDHVLADRHQLGLFTVAGPDDPDEPWAPRWAPWMPLMRTFTGLGDRTNILDRDKKVFFPRWRRRGPDPFYWESRHGIVTRPEEDPLH